MPSSRERLKPIMGSKKKGRERDKPTVDLIFTWWRNCNHLDLGWEAVVQSLNDPSIDLSVDYRVYKFSTRLVYMDFYVVPAALCSL
ncbi:hypothetical protein FEM48_Zijuj04G0197900 [Ziziphus jujuba var. spinosa]|uniref:Uncharacterized protein n=1 Tax=Ziziphus jujuba var. spinosa TaxID=714518 RepID=A0A978VLU6_ZIZJJ|nr:hypothetical protein FEM48_Zijuj04G0197900 [Ziziphus jujuba var. spinosa]